MCAIAQRPRAARRLHSLRRHVPHVLRLRAQRAAHGGADEAALTSSCSRTTRSASARTGRRTSRSSTRRACASSRSMDVWRPCDTVETAVAWAAAIERDGRPVVRCCSRARTCAFAAARRGADRVDPPRRLRARRLRTARAPSARSSSRPARKSRSRCGARERSRPKASRCASSRCRARSVFDRQDAAYRARVLPRGRSARRGRGGRRPTAGASTSAPRTIRAARSSASTRFGESAPAARAVQAFRLHRRERRRERAVSASVSVALRERERIVVARPPHAGRRAGDRAACASTAGARRIAGMIPDAYLDGDERRGQRRALGARADGRAQHAQRVRRATMATASSASRRRTGCAEPKHGFDAELAAIYLAPRRQRAGLGRRLVARRRRGAARARRHRPHRPG